MTKIRLTILLILAVVIVLPLLALAVVVSTKPNVGPAPTLTITATPELVARGSYLFNHGAACVACHTPWDKTRFSFPPVAGKEGSGGEAFGANDGVPGVIYAANLTPAALKDWSDGEIYRAIASGVRRDGQALFPLMPWQHYAKLSEPDLYALIAYLRTLPAVENTVPERQLSFPMNVIVRLIPTAAHPPAATPAASDPAYPAYVVNAAACLHCHSPSEHGKIAPGDEFTGGVPFPLPTGGVARSANLTPDETTGLGRWSKEAFIQRFRAANGLAKQPVKPGELNTPMPWSTYAGMTDADLGAIYDYLRALKPVAKQVEKFTR